MIANQAIDDRTMLQDKPAWTAAQKAQFKELEGTTTMGRVLNGAGIALTRYWLDRCRERLVRPLMFRLALMVALTALLACPRPFYPGNPHCVKPTRTARRRRSGPSLWITSAWDIEPR